MSSKKKVSHVASSSHSSKKGKATVKAAKVSSNSAIPSSAASNSSLPSYDFMLDELYKELSSKRKGSAERFQMPVVDVTVEGNRTVFRNFSTFCEKVRREPELVAKFISREFGAPARIEGKRLILQKRVKRGLFQKKMELFVDYYVLCHECGKPDTKIVNIEGVHYLVCEACGARRPLKK